MKDFRIHISCVLLVVSLMNTACDKEITGTAQFNHPFELELNERTVFSESANGLSLLLKSVNDSRCPIDVNCISAGSAKVQFQLLDSSGIEALGELCIGYCDNHNNKPEDSTIILLNKINYSVSLISVNPYPSKVSTNANKKVMFILNKK